MRLRLVGVFHVPFAQSYSNPWRGRTAFTTKNVSEISLPDSFKDPDVDTCVRSEQLLSPSDCWWEHHHRKPSWTDNWSWRSTPVVPHHHDSYLGNVKQKLVYPFIENENGRNNLSCFFFTCHGTFPKLVSWPPTIRFIRVYVSPHSETTKWIIK